MLKNIIVLEIKKNKVKGDTMKIIEKIQASIIIFICIVFLLIPLTKATNVKIETYAIDPILVTDQAYADIVYT